MRVLRFIVRNWPLKIGAVLLAAILYGAMVVLQSTTSWQGAVPTRTGSSSWRRAATQCSLLDSGATPRASA